jgi:hypothetical protein
MICPRYIVFDDAPQARRLGWHADQLADALRSPLAAIGVRVVRQHSAGSTSPMAGFRARGWSRSQYNTKLNMVDDVVNGVMKNLAGEGNPSAKSGASVGEPLKAAVQGP